mmetsp:Transcript_16714/g.33410  ORF Transcript_16714/g.33410 Transcript_16714/m.33410 type:complete len:201 (+) Transcript_16714:877-1479(+)
MPRGRCYCQRTHPFLVSDVCLMVRVRPCLQQHLDDLSVSVVGGSPQRAAPFHILSLDSGAALKQDAHGVVMPVLRCHEQWCFPPLVGHADFGAQRKQGFDCARVPPVCRSPHRHAPFRILGFNVGPCLYQDLDSGGVPCCRRRHQWCLRHLRGAVRACTSLEQQLHALVVSRERSQPQRVHALLVVGVEFVSTPQHPLLH